MAVQDKITNILTQVTPNLFSPNNIVLVVKLGVAVRIKLVVGTKSESHPTVVFVGISFPVDWSFVTVPAPHSSVRRHELLSFFPLFYNWDRAFLDVMNFFRSFHSFITGIELF